MKKHEYPAIRWFQVCKETRFAIDPRALAGLHVDLTVLWDPAMHGTVMEPDFDGVDPARRAVLALEGGKSAWVYDPQQSPSELLALAAREGQVKSPATALVLSLATVSTEASGPGGGRPPPPGGPQDPAARGGGVVLPG